MEKLFQTKDGAQLYAVIKNDEIISLHSADAHRIVPALKEDLLSNDYIARNLAVILLTTIDRLGINWIEG